MYASPVFPLPYKVMCKKTGAYSTFGSWKLKWKSGNESRSVMFDSLRPHGLFSPWNSPGQNTGVGSRSLLQGIFPTQGSNPGLPHCRWILYQLSHEGSSRILEWVGYLFWSGSSWLRNWTGVSCITGGFFTSWATREAIQPYKGMKFWHMLQHGRILKILSEISWT